MTIKELIEALSQYPEDMEVLMNIDFEKWRDITKVGEAMKYRIEPHSKDEFQVTKEIKFCGIQ